jgi:predicted nucleic acid-binding Zn ribbon protein
MPTYDFMNNETGEEFTEIMTMSERVTYLAENPHIKQLITRMNMVSGSGIKNDDGWKENLSRIAEAHPNSTLADKQGGRGTRAAKTSAVLEKHGVKKGKYTMNL